MGTASCQFCGRDTGVSGVVVWCECSGWTDQASEPVVEVLSDRDARWDRTNEELEAEASNPYAVGSVWYTSWGYDQTNVEFYVVERETKASVWVRECAQFAENGRVFPDTFAERSGEPEMHRKAREWGPYLRMDSVRHAWPYEGGGKYETYTAGGAGH